MVSRFAAITNEDVSKKINEEVVTDNSNKATKFG